MSSANELVHVPQVERLSPTCIRILGGNPGKFTLQGTNTYIIGTGHRRILIDTGEGRPAWIESIKATLKQERATIESVLISHWHLDHTGGIKDVLELLPASKIYKCHPVDQQQEEICDKQIFAVPGATLTAFHTPGHTADHMVFVLEEEDAMFTADNVLGQKTAVFEDLALYTSSLEKMRGLFNGRAYPGHGPVVDNGTSKIVEYLEHRKQREEQVLATLKTATTGAASWSAMDIVKVVYKDVPEELYPAACGGVVQVLSKLEGDGRILEDASGRWQLKDTSVL